MMKLAHFLTGLVLLVAAHQYLPAQTSHVSSEDILKAAFRLKKAADAAGTVAEDAVQYCKATRQKVTTADLEKAIAENLTKHNSNASRPIPASSMWKVADVADILQFDIGISTMGCALHFNEDYRAQRTASAGLKAYSSLSDAKVEFEKMALQQTKWQEEQQEMLREQ